MDVLSEDFCGKSELLGSKIVSTLGWLGVAAIIIVILLIAVGSIVLNKSKKKK